MLTSNEQGRAAPKSKISRRFKHNRLRREIHFELLENRLVMASLASANEHYDPSSYTTNAAGLPQLHSYASGRAVVFMDFDGFDQNGDGSYGGSNDHAPYNTSGSASTFSSSEQSQIVDVWRKASMLLSGFDLDVTTVQPAAGTKPYIWVMMKSSGSGRSGGNYSTNPSAPNGYGNATPTGYTNALHEIGHALGLAHDSSFDEKGILYDNYGGPLYDTLHGRLMGGHGSGAVIKFNSGNIESGTHITQDDPARIASRIATAAGAGDGYKPDLGNNSVANASTMASLGNNSYADWDTVERITDTDYYKLTPTTSGYYSFAALRDGGFSPVDLAIAITDSSGKVIGAESGDVKAATLDYSTTEMVNDHHVTVWLNSGTTYYTAVSSQGNSHDIGQYVLRADLVSTVAAEKWHSHDIGLNGVAGYSDNNSGTFLIAGSGRALYDVNEDSGHFLYQKLSGNGEISAHVSSILGSGAGGLMIRKSLAANDLAVNLQYLAGETFFNTRTTVGGTSVSVNSTTNYSWLRIVRSGTNGETFTFYGKVNPGDAWTQIGSPQTITGFTGTVFIGLVSSDTQYLPYHRQQLTKSTIDNVSLSAASGGVLNPDLALNALTSPPLTVASTTSTSTIAVTLTWTDPNGSAENGYIVERSMDGVNFTVLTTSPLSASARTYTDSGLSGGVTYTYAVRAKTGSSTPAYSPRNTNATIVTKAGPVDNLRGISISDTEIVLDWREGSGESGYAVQRRTATSGSGSTWTTIATLPATASKYYDSGLTANKVYYYRIQSLTNNNTTATAYSPTMTIYTRRNAIVNNVHVSSATPSVVTIAWDAFIPPTGTGTVTNYSIYRSDHSGPFTYNVANISNFLGTSTTTTFQDTSPLASLEVTYYFVIANTTQGSTLTSADSTTLAVVPGTDPLPTGWTSQDIGDVGSPGAWGLTSHQGTDLITMYGSGDTIEDGTDAYYALSTSITGWGAITARVYNASAIFGGIMLRESMAADSRYVFLGMEAGGGWLEVKDTTGQPSVFTFQPSVNYGSLIEIDRSGSHIVVFVSNDDGANWDVLADLNWSGLPSAMLYQLVACNGDNSGIGFVDFYDVSIYDDGIVTYPFYPPAELMMMSGESELSEASGSTSNQGMPIDAVTVGLNRVGNDGPVVMPLAAKRDGKNRLAALASDFFGSLSAHRPNRYSDFDWDLLPGKGKGAIRKRDAFFALLAFDQSE